ncbi:hypothetical protein AVEN_206486-1 [Araneus ventricosus]|uniref:Uncharacterized protein n=1 Tax=Araneus ventricosus TaxID=182803 RepID=A0A4Y2SWC5_ARAVE|nr:hypothetical protein AVEN_206486-1 [Araneus ventricosus]
MDDYNVHDVRVQDTVVKILSVIMTRGFPRRKRVIHEPFTTRKTDHSTVKLIINGETGRTRHGVESKAGYLNCPNLLQATSFGLLGQKSRNMV